MSGIEIVQGGRPNFEKLAKAGRIKMKPDGTPEGVPANNVLYTKKKAIFHETGVKIGEIEIPVNGGHAKKAGSVWRVALGGPKRYHELAMRDKKRSELRGGDYADLGAPELEDEEADEYKLYKEFLAEKGVEIAENEDFYAWKDKPKSKAKKEDSAS